MGFEVRLYKRDSIVEGAQLALDHKLHEPGINYWLQHRLRHIAGHDCTAGESYWPNREFVKPLPDNACIAIGVLDLTPVSLVTYDDIFDGITVAAYCKPEYRRRGIAGNTLDHLREIEALDIDQLKAGKGATGSLDFWNKQGVRHDYL